MPASKAQQKATNKYIAKAYDRINLTVPKGKKDTIQAHAEAQGQSVNAYINAAVDSRIAQEVAGEPQEAWVVFLPSDTLKTAREAAEAAGEDLPQFVTRAVETQVQRDKASRVLGINPATGGRPEKEG